MANEMTPAPEMTPASEMTPAPLQYRSVGVRFVALLIDVIIAGIIAAVFANPLQTPVFNSANFTNGSFYVSTTANSLAGLGSVLSSLIVLFYFTLLLGAYGQTVGMMALKIKVVKEDGSKIGYVDALVRSLLLIIDAIPYLIPFLLGAILIWTSDKRQRIGDRAAHTVVVTA
ncbi:MAG: RDD family protein [Halobacteriota archaeon]